jgi:multidrug efflux pump subunit AcrA (membrane-fusion protein)
VQSTVTGTGNVAAGTDDTVNFQTSGTLQDVYVTTGQHVNAGQLIADLDPTSAQLSLDQANESLTAAEDNLSCLQGVTSDCGSGGSGSVGSGSTGSGSTGSGSSDTGDTSTTSYSPSPGGTIEYASFKPPAGKGNGKGKSGSGTVVATKTTPSVTVTVVVPSTTPSKGSSASSGSGSSAAHSTSTQATTTTSTPSPGSIASAQASVYSAEASVHNAEVALNETKLYAPVSGTIASLSSLTPGEAVSAGSGSSSSSTGSSSSSSSSTTGGGITAGSLGGTSSSSSSSSSGFAEIVNANTLTMTVAFSESDISKLKVGQPATVTMDALAGVELAAHVSQISLVGSTSSSVVSYDATLQLDQNDSQVKPGMSASASVITGQASGVTLPNSAVTGTGSLATVNVLKNGKTVPTQVVVGLRGDSRTQIISGLSAGQQVQVTITLPSLSSTSTTGSGSSGTLGGATGAGRFGGAGGGLGGAGLGGGGGAFFRGAGGG